MKKILFSVTICFFCVCGACFAECNSPTTIAYDGNQKVDDDEFLYPDESNYLAAKNGYENTKHKTSGDGKGYECDKLNFKICNDGSRITLNAGHYFGGQRVDVKTTYECYARAMGNDVWKPVVSKDVCSTPVYGDIDVGKQYSKYLTKAECSGYPLTDQNGVEFALICRDGPTLVCMAMKCIEGMRADNGKCVLDKKGSGGNNSQTCREGRTTAEGKACCDLPENVADWNGSKCNCLGGKEFKIVEGKGQCVVAGGGDDEGNAVTPYKCSDFDITLINSWKVDCKDSLTVMQLIQQFELKCKDPNLTVAEFNKMSNQVSLSVERNCQPVIEEVIKPDNSQARAAIIAAGDALDGIVAGFGKSKWKNAQGEFNTARLASDSIAAVVLGTAGGLITSSVMKKHQVEDGFEDLKCVIGGQPVAGWGDEFRVGIQ